MNTLRKIVGFCWMLAAVLLTALIPYFAVSKLNASNAGAEDFVFWMVIVLIFIPIIIGFLLFGYYAFKGEYDERV